MDKSTYLFIFMNACYPTSRSSSKLYYFCYHRICFSLLWKDYREVLYLRREYQHTLSIPADPSFIRPLLIYDDRCLSCGQFAFWVKKLSGGWIRLAGHYNSPEAMKVKKAIFPDGYDPTQMFWLINKNGAFGARSGLMEVFKEIIRGILKTRIGSNVPNDCEGCILTQDVTLFNNHSCDHLAGSSCASIRDTWTRTVDMLRNSGKYSHRAK
jgi:hypothetical protein